METEALEDLRDALRHRQDLSHQPARLSRHKGHLHPPQIGLESGHAMGQANQRSPGSCLGGLHLSAGRRYSSGKKLLIEWASRPLQVAVNNFWYEWLVGYGFCSAEIMSPLIR